MDHLSAAVRGEAFAAESEAADDGDVFKALADPSRRLLLDSLFEADGQTLGELTRSCQA